jgi:hypothetical protein
VRLPSSPYPVAVVGATDAVGRVARRHELAESRLRGGAHVRFVSEARTGRRLLERAASRTARPNQAILPGAGRATGGPGRARLTEDWRNTSPIYHAVMQLYRGET